MSKVYDYVSEKILSMLDEGVVPWQKPWRIADIPRNFKSGYNYNGINVWLLLYEQMTKGYKYNMWMSFKQGKEMKATVKKGEKSSMVIFWKFNKYVNENDNGEEVEKTVPILRYYNVFNIEQFDWEDEAKKNELIDKYIGEPLSFEPNEEAERLVENYKFMPELTEGGSEAYYLPSLDKINMPIKDVFESIPKYYSTLFHEIGHSTGHKDRLNRFKSNVNIHDYAEEELVAEFFSSMIAAHVGFGEEVFEHNASYIDSWRRKISKDKKIVVWAASRAEKAYHLFVENKMPNENKVKEEAE